MADLSFDLVVIGSGPGGYVAAIRAAQVGLKTAVVEKGAVGGRCLNVACIPAKAVLRSADILSEIQEAEEFGINVPAPTVDFAKVHERRESVISTLTGGVAGLLKKNGVELIEGFGKLTADGNVEVEGVGTLTATKGVLLATGSVRRNLPASSTASASSAPRRPGSSPSSPARSQWWVLAPPQRDRLGLRAPRLQGHPPGGPGSRRAQRGRRHLTRRGPRL